MVHNQQTRLIRILGSSKGFSLTEVILAGALMGFFVLATSQVVLTNKKTELVSQRVNSLDREHLLSIQKARDLTRISNVLAGAGVNFASLQTRQCMSKAAASVSFPVGQVGINCAGLSTTVNNVYLSGKNSQYSPGGSGSGQAAGPQDLSNFISQMNVELLCSAIACDRVKILVSTEENSGVNKLGRRQTEIVVPAPTLTNKAEIVFDCDAINKLATGIHFGAHTDVCTASQIPQPPCTGGPLASADGSANPTNCQVPETRAPCADGVGGAGAFQNQSNCNTPPTTIQYVPQTLPPPATLPQPPGPPATTPPAYANVPTPPTPGISCGPGSNVCGANFKTCFRADRSNYCLPLLGSPCGVGEVTCSDQPTTSSTTPPNPPPTCLGPGQFYTDNGYTCGFEATFDRSGTDGMCCNGNAKGFCNGPGSNPQVRCSGGATTTTMPPSACNGGYQACPVDGAIDPVLDVCGCTPGNGAVGATLHRLVCQGGTWVRFDQVLAVNSPCP